MIRNLSINDEFWIGYSESRISFRWKSMPTQTHFTIATHKNSELINFHLTKENGIDKPQLRLIEIRKDELEEICQVLNNALNSKMITEIEVSDFKHDYDKLEFISLTRIDEFTEYRLLDEILKNSIIEDDKLTNKKISLKGNFTKRIEEFLLVDEVAEVLEESISTLSNIFENDIKGDGFVKLQSDSEGLLRISDKWYHINLNIDLKNILINLLGSQLFKQIEETYYNYLDVISTIETKEESRRFSTPFLIRIARSEELSGR